MRSSARLLLPLGGRAPVPAALAGLRGGDGRALRGRSAAACSSCCACAPHWHPSSACPTPAAGGRRRARYLLPAGHRAGHGALGRPLRCRGGARLSARMRAAIEAAGLSPQARTHLPGPRGLRCAARTVLLAACAVVLFNRSSNHRVAAQTLATRLVQRFARASAPGRVVGVGAHHRRVCQPLCWPVAGPILRYVASCRAQRFARACQPAVLSGRMSDAAEEASAFLRRVVRRNNDR